jgi:hypothetical protein
MHDHATRSVLKDSVAADASFDAAAQSIAAASTSAPHLSRLSFGAALICTTVLSMMRASSYVYEAHAVAVLIQQGFPLESIGCSQQPWQLYPQFGHLDV